ncbi:EF-P lysine aminoacylase EpmA [Neptunomonas sp. XY-337]|uniref:EF-P lysine aminoacylase EpmA n=1 Tax=Neptunomonas sp. XY-337 TaxID=2561897 RepID=UPI0010AAD192|nr:EF-P lysine aminoacylase EpmA [Neptunomonas sp. XY-337]
MSLHWQPSTTVAALHQRAAILAQIRQHFANEAVLEVDTAVLSQCAVSDPFIDSFELSFRSHPDNAGQACFLQTSPEYAMKRLLAAGSGSIYQLGKVFRNGEAGRFHNPEFTMLEWYRIGFDEHALMDDIERLLTPLLPDYRFERISYDALFERELGIELASASNAQLAAQMRQHVDVEHPMDDRDGWLNLLMSHVIEPRLRGSAVFVTDYPASQAALARLKRLPNGQQVAARFELFVDGIELANGYHELTDANEQERRFLQDNVQRKQLGLPQRPLDMRLVAALQSGLPDCAGVALGVDRLVMLATKAAHIEEVIPFMFEQA